MAAKATQHCTEKHRLLMAYNRAVLEWSHAVRDLSDQAGAGNSHFLLLMSKVGAARTTTQRAKSAYSAHVAEHRC
jgi:hypothetical protein